MKKYKIVNLTHHDVRIITHKGEEFLFKKTGLSVRCNIDMIKTDPINGIPCKFKDIYNVESTLPPREEGTLYLVSSMVLDSNPERDDLISPDTSRHSSIKDKKGKVIAARGFQRIRKK